MATFTAGDSRREHDVSRPSLGVVVIAKNEARDMPGFLAHLLPWVHEIVVVDDESTDATREIVSAAGPKVKLIQRRLEPIGGFAAQRNFGIMAAHADWLLHMDVDERVTPELAQQIRAAIKQDNRHGFRYRRLNFFLHAPVRGGGWQNWNKPQLARRGKHRFEKAIHEECLVEGGEEVIGQLNGMMWHLNDESYVERVEKNLRYMQLSGDEIVRRGVKVRWYHMLCHPLYRALRTYVVDGGYRDGIRGWLLALYTFSGTFNWWAYAWDQQNNRPRDELEKDLESQWKAWPEKENYDQENDVLLMPSTRALAGGNPMRNDPL